MPVAVVTAAPQDASTAGVVDRVDEAKRRCKGQLAAVRRCYQVQRKKGSEPGVRCAEYMRAQAYCLGKQLCKSEHSALPRTCTAACPYTASHGGKHCDVWVQPMQRCLERALGEGWNGPQPKS
jgi:hypothetical protein